jgi:hypothetical protein
MDPYLEDPAEWPGVHQRLITYAADTLTALLPSTYAAIMGERVLVLSAERSIYPDVGIAETPVVSQRRDADGVATAVIEASDEPCVLVLPLVERREVYIDIVRGKDRSDVVTAIEILSPTNKTGGAGRGLYLQKQREVLDSATHLIEIDLLRAGEYTVAAPPDWAESLKPWDYLVSLRRSGAPPQFEVWPIPLRRRLPRLRVPLAGDDPDVLLDLQDLLDRCYSLGGYQNRIDYSIDPIPPLDGETADWARQLLRERGLRS